MAENYFDPAEAAPVQGDTASADASKSGVRKAWDAWTSKPENNAALLQFGIAMMQPRPQGQSSFGQFGNAVGSAGEASTANVAAQNLEKDREAQRGERESMAGYRDAQAAAAGKNAESYSRQVDAMGGGRGSKSAASQALAQQRAFSQWLKAPVDAYGLQQDPILEAIKQKFPNVKSKADIINDNSLATQVYKMFGPKFAEDDAGPAAAPPAAQPAEPGVAATPPPGVPAGAKQYNGRWYTRGPNGEAVPVPGY